MIVYTKHSTLKKLICKILEVIFVPKVLQISTNLKIFFMKKRILELAKPFPLDGNIESLLPLPEVREVNEDKKTYRKGFHPLKHRGKRKKS
jgi:hypothetical protein